MQKRLSVREMNESDIENVVDYFLNSPTDYLLGMGADPSKLPSKEKWTDFILGELNKNYSAKEIYYIIWQLDGRAIGHSNINKIVFGKEAYMHLHMWGNENRQKGLGLEFVRMSIPYYFKNFDLQVLICEPYALNPAPAKIPTALGFDFVQEHEIVPGWISFLQKVKRFELTREKWEKGN